MNNNDNNPSNNENNLLSMIGVVTASSKQVESSVIQKMQNELEKEKINSLKKEIERIQQIIDAYPLRNKIYEIKNKKDIKDPDILYHYNQYKNLQKLKQQLKDEQNTSSKSSFLKKRQRESSLPGNLTKRPRLDIESEQERQIRLGKATPFIQLQQIEQNQKENQIRITNQQKTKRKKKPRVSQSFKSTNVPTSNRIIKKKKQINIPTTNTKNNEQNDITLQLEIQKNGKLVNDFITEDDDVILQDGYHLPKRIYKKLFEHQQTSVKWLWELYKSELGGIIADEMGLGKTIQVVSFIAGLHYSGLIKLPTIIVCPTTIMTQWQLEFTTWWPHIPVEILHSTECNNFKDLIYNIKHNCGVLITSYGTLQAYRNNILPMDFELVVLDEGHKIRNPDALITITCKQLRSPNRIILTGAPIQNNLQELWSLFDFIFPGKLGTLPVFKEKFEKPISMGGYSNATRLRVQTAYKCAVVLRDEINPYLLRRMKQDVNIGLPDKHEQVLFCPLLPNQKKLYTNALNSDTIAKVLLGKANLLAATITLRKICNHPDIISKYSRDVSSFGHWSRSGKMTVLQKLLPLWKEDNHKCLIFTQTRVVLDILEHFCIEMGFTYLRMDGTTPVKQRPGLIEKYQSDDSIFLFLLTSKTGGIGVNLTKADRIILYDPDWNPTTDIQARERAWRIGQLNSVTIYRLITSGTIEEKIYQRQIYKQFLSNKILKDPRQKRLFHSKILKDLFSYEDPDDGITITCGLLYDNKIDIDNIKDNTNDKEMWESTKDKDEDIDNFISEIKNEIEKPEKKNVLAEVLSSTGIKHILSHDSIVDESQTEITIINQEATTIANNAAKALKKSVKECINNAVHIPTWTGSSGSAGAPTKRFGNIKNYSKLSQINETNKISNKSINNYTEETSPITWTSSSNNINSNNIKQRLNELNNKKKQKFGSLNVRTNYFQVSNQSTNKIKSSTDIINNLKTRSAVEKGKSGILVKDQDEDKINEITKRLHKLFKDNNNIINSQTIVANFQDIISHKDKLFFKNLLKKIAILDRKEHLWKLKQKYHNK